MRRYSTYKIEQSIERSECDFLPKGGYSIGESRAYHTKLWMVWVIDASKGDERWVVHAESRYEAAVELRL